MKFRKQLPYLVLCLALALTTTAFAATKEGGPIVQDPNKYSDIRGHWAEDAMVTALKNGIMYGTTATSVSPDAPITRSQMAAFMVRAFEPTKTAPLSVFVDMNASQWYYNYISRAIQMGIIQGNGNAINPDSNITREDAAIIFCRAFNLFGYTDSLASYSDKSQISSYAEQAMASCVGAGIMGGSGGELQPKKALTRAEFVSMLSRIVNLYVNSAVPYGGQGTTGSMIVTTPGITLANATISGNLYIADGVENGTVTLDHFTVQGRIFVRGGSKIIMKNGSTAESIVIYNPNTAVSLDIDRSSRVVNTIIDTAVGAITASGTVGNVLMNTASATLHLKGATVGNLTSNVLLPTISIDKDTTVSYMYINSGSESAVVTVDGDVRNINVDGNKTKLTTTKGAKTDNIMVNCQDSTLTIGSATRNLGISDKSNDNTFNIGSTATVNSFSIGNGTGNTFDIAGNADMSTITIDEKRANNELAIKSSKFTIDSKASDSRITFLSGTSITDLEVNASNVRLYVNKGASIRNINAYASGLDVSGSGTVNTIYLQKNAYSVTVNTNNTTINNKRDSSATVNGYHLADGKSVNSSKLEDVYNNNEKNSSNSSSSGTSSSFTVYYASNMQPTDLDANGTYSLSQFCSGVSLSNNNLKGRVLYNPNYIPPYFSRTCYYVPVVISPNNKTDSYTIEVAGHTFRRSDENSRGNYSGNVVIMLPLDPSLTNKRVAITYDADGSSSKYSPVTNYVYYSNVTFVNDETFRQRSEVIEGVAPVSGAQELIIASHNANAETRIATFNVHSGSGAITKQTVGGVSAYWGGLRFAGPSKATKASYTVTVNNRSNTYNSNCATTTIKGNTYPAFQHFEDIEGISRITFEIVWFDSAGVQLTNTETYIFDLTSVVCGSSGGNTNPDTGNTPTQKEYVATLATVSVPGKIAYVASTGLELNAFGSAINFTKAIDGSEQIYMAGTYNKVRINGSAAAGYYIPMRLTFSNVKEKFNIKLGNTFLETVQAPTNANFLVSVNLLIPITESMYLGSAIKSFNLSMTPTSENYLERVYRVTSSNGSARINDSVAFISDAPLTSTTRIYGKTVADLVGETYRFYDGGTTGVVTGSYNKVELANSDFVQSTGWYAPLLVSNAHNAGISWSVVVTYGADHDTVSFNATSSEYTKQILIPLGYVSGDTAARYDTVNVTIKEGQTTVLSCDISTAGTTLIDYPTSSGGNSDTPPLPVVTLDSASNFSLGSLTYSDFVESPASFSVTAQGSVLSFNGNLKAVTVGTDFSGWAIPVIFKIENANGTVVASITGTGVNNRVTSAYNEETNVATICSYIPVAVKGNGTNSDTKLSNIRFELFNSNGAPITAFTYGTAPTEQLKGFNTNTSGSGTGTGTGPSAPTINVTYDSIPATNSFAIGSNNYATYVDSGYTATKVGSNVSFKGTINPVIETAAGSEGNVTWYVPYVLTRSSAGVAATVEIKNYSQLINSYTWEANASNTLNILIPIAYARSSRAEPSRYNYVTVKVGDDFNLVVASNECVIKSASSSSGSGSTDSGNSGSSSGNTDIVVPGITDTSTITVSIPSRDQLNSDIVDLVVWTAPNVQYSVSESKGVISIRGDFNPQESTNGSYYFWAFPVAFTRSDTSKTYQIAIDYGDGRNSASFDWKSGVDVAVMTPYIAYGITNAEGVLKTNFDNTVISILDGSDSIARYTVSKSNITLIDPK